VRLDIFSDPICPWCYIGKEHLDKGMRKSGVNIFDLRWHPFQLNPNMNPDGMDRERYLVRKFGGKAEAIKAYNPIIESVRQAGLSIKLEAIKKTPSTFDAHRLIHWSETENCQTELVEALFKAYFVNGRDIGDKRQLAEIAGEIGLNKTMISRLLESENDRELLTERDENARKMGINAVPTFIVGGRHVVQGGQSTAFWTKVISEISENFSIGLSAQQ
tara:strand:+ start:268 stop:921 length:654 start_codon:yes stop_codon:yes gene_type:complete